MGKEADKSNICAAGRRVFEDPMQRREHSRLNRSCEEAPFSEPPLWHAPRRTRQMHRLRQRVGLVGWDAKRGTRPDHRRHELVPLVGAPINRSVAQIQLAPQTKARRQPPAAAVSWTTSSELILVVRINPCARSKWRRARRVAPSSTPSDLTAYPSFASAIWAARTRGDPPSGLPRKRAPIWSGPSAAERRSPLGADDRCCLPCAAGAIEEVVSGADAWVARDMSLAGGAAAEAVLYSEVRVGGAYGATGSTVPAGAAVLAEAGKGSCATEARSGAGCGPICSRRALAPIPATSAATPALM